MKRRFVHSIILLSLFLFSGYALSAEYWGSKNSNKYHYPSCKWALKISPKNLIKFNSPESAISAGYVPCKVCSPPIKSKAAVDTTFRIAAWEGFDYDRGSYIEIDKGNSVRTGRDIEIYDHSTGTYKDVEVQSINRTGSSVEIEVYDHDAGEYRTFEMD